MALKRIYPEVRTASGAGSQGGSQTWCDQARIMCNPSLQVEGMTGIEPASSAWKAEDTCCIIQQL